MKGETKYGTNLTEAYFATARERYRIRKRRIEGKPWPWSEDAVFQDWAFCNVHREHDRTTVWFRENVRSHITGQLLVRATFIFRQFNRIETGERLLDLLLNGWDSAEARRLLTGVRPLVTGAHMVHFPTGMDALTGMLHVIDEGLPLLDELSPRWGGSLEEAWTDLKKLSNVGSFLAYEIVTDLRWTRVLANAGDITTWANVGPGSILGISEVVGERFKQNAFDRQVVLMVMRMLLRKSQRAHYWPQNWPLWEMREVEHWACEFFKYMKASRGGSLKRRYKRR